MNVMNECYEYIIIISIIIIYILEHYTTLAVMDSYKYRVY